MEVAKPITFRQAREFSEIVNITFSFIRQNFLHLGKCILFIVGPLILLDSILFARWYQQALTFESNPDLSSFYTGYFFNLLFGAVTFTILAAVIYEYIALYMEKGRETFEVGEVLRAVLRDLGKFVVAVILGGLAVIAGYFLCVLPGIYLGIAFSLALVIVALEQKDGFAALSRSKDLITGNWWQTFGLILVIAVIQMALSMVFYVPFYVILVIIGLNSADPEMMQSSLHSYLLFLTMAIMVGAYLLHTLQVVAIAFQYFNLVERKEGTGLLQEIEQIGGEPA
ncbi:MAG: hypothetical protein ACE5IY_13940 [bacterium]